ncbi:Peptidase-M28 domain-containing protein [Aphelenchoides bicaudatus]|nr:Peptidase-M28 domain-containing protein [Aphelenchoides bicaudatus]
MQINLRFLAKKLISWQYDDYYGNTAPLKWWHWTIYKIFVVLIFIMAFFLDRHLPSVVPASDYSRFSEARARQFLKDFTSLGPRPVYSPNLQTVNGIISSSQNNKPAVLLNCHLDSVSAGPGATDDGAACAIYLDVLEVITRRKLALQNDLIVIFNGGGNNLNGEKKLTVKAHEHLLLNIDGKKTQPSTDSWILEAYAAHSQHPHFNIIAQEIFQSGVVPSYTDFVVYSGQANLGGIDFAYYKNGWVYHTSEDIEDIIPKGSLQRAGDNILAVVDALLKSPNMNSKSTYSGKHVFFDVVGLFAVSYRAFVAIILNVLSLIFVILLVALHLKFRKFNWKNLLFAIGHHLLVFVAMILLGLLIAGFLIAVGGTRTWNSSPFLVLIFYIYPTLGFGYFIHSIFVYRQQKLIENGEDDGYEGFATKCRIRSSRCHVDFVFIKILKKDPKSWHIFVVQLVCQFCSLLMLCYMSVILFSFSIPVLGREARQSTAELAIMGTSVLVTYCVVLLTSNLLYITAPNPFIRFFAHLYCLLKQRLCKRELNRQQTTNEWKL